ncbi:MAG: CoB--CoM heterodisulfide reductase iron-sulfur subunit B family protein [Bacteroidota bacterium]
MKCLYFPGCSQKASSISYEKSFLAICRQLGVELVELNDWNCCGATVAISVNEVVAMTLAARNLALVNDNELPVVAPCPSCYISLNKVNKVFKGNRQLAGCIKESLQAGGLDYNGKVRVYNVLEFLVKFVGIDTIRQKVLQPLKGMRIAPYYGCQLVSPYSEGDNNDNPTNLETIIAALGGTPVDFPFRTKCCGGSLMITRQHQAERMSCEVLKSIDKEKADIIVTPCGLCQINLDMSKGVFARQLGRKIETPVLNISQLIGFAFDIEPSELHIKSKNLRRRLLVEN